MKNMRKVVSTLLLVCILASMMVVSASADGLVKFTTPSQGSVTIDEGSSYTLTINEMGLDKSVYCYYWKINDQYVDASGAVVEKPMAHINVPNLVFSKGAGTYTVTVEVARMADSVTVDTATTVVTVNEGAPALSGVVFNQDSVQLNGMGSSAVVYATKIPADAEGTVSVVSSNPNIATYDPSTQTVVATGAGETALTASVGGFTASIPVYVTLPVSSISIDTPYINVTNGAPDGTINYTVITDGASYPTLQWTSSNAKVASVVDDNNSGAAVVRFNGANGTATITATSTDGTAVNGKCLVTVEGGDKTFVEVTPVKAELVVGESTTLTAYVSGKDAEGDTAYFDHWLCSSSAVQLTRDGNTATVKALSAVNNPIEVRAYSNDGKFGYALIYITKADPLELTASAYTVKANKTVVVTAANARPNETFTWSYTPNDLGFIKSTSVKGNSFSLVGGDLEGSITVTCVSNNDSTRTGSVTIGINSVDPYGNASITPKSVTWLRGNGDLSFQVSPAAYYTYLDNQYLNTKSTSLASYWNGTLTLKAAFLNTLSNGNHTLKVYTATDSENNPTGLVYATIAIEGNGATGASATYGDNAHVKGAASNLYFNSGNPISEIYISGKWIDPSNFSISTDGKTLTLSSSFLNQLPYGSYTMQINGSNGTTQTTNFRIVTANYAPSTGDETNIGLWVAIMLLSGAGAVALIPKKKGAED